MTLCIIWMCDSLLASAKRPVYPICEKFTKLSSLVRLFNIKAGHGMSDKCFSKFHTFIKELLPKRNGIPTTIYEAKKTL